MNGTLLNFKKTFPGKIANKAELIFIIREANPVSIYKFVN